jgi:hypothetical protein
MTFNKKEVFQTLSAIFPMRYGILLIREQRS